MEKTELLKEELRDLYYQTENSLALLKTIPDQKLERVKDNLVQKQVILAQAIKLFDVTV